jgi:histidinol-phosphate aminotransferase
VKYEIEKRLLDMIPYKPIEGEFKVRLDANESFFSIPDNILKEFESSLKDIDFNRYPDPYSKEVCYRFARSKDIDVDSVIAGNGSDELINLIIQVFLKDGDKVLTLAPDFSMYRFYSDLRRAEVISVNNPYDEPIDVYALIQAIEESKPKIVIFSNPCNPTGQVISRDNIIKLLQKCPNILFVVDEAYMDFSDQSILNIAKDFSNVIVLRTMSKAFAAASIRLGFAVSNRELISTMKKVKAPYNINSVTQKFGSILLSHSEENKQRIEKIIRMRDNLYAGLQRYTDEIKVFPSGGNFIYVSTIRAKEIYDKLLSDGIAIRYFNNNTLRISAGNEEEQSALFSSLDNIFKNRGEK